jgi:hypothetical protein
MQAMEIVVSNPEVLGIIQAFLKNYKQREALKRFKQNSSYFMYKSANGAWRNY